MNSNISKLNPGSELIQRYIDALTNLITMERAKITASRTESDLLEHLDSLGTQNGVYLTPEEIPAVQGESLLKESFNAHLTKVQSEQIAQKSKAEVARLNEQTKKEFIGKKIIVDVIYNDSNPIDGVYINKQTGQYRVSKFKTKRIKGTVLDIIFENNLLVIKPNLTARTLTPNRIFIHVYVINLDNMSPNVSIII
jgi:hypothetical protein